MASRQEVLRGLEVLGAMKCVYSDGVNWADRCDCKYGIQPSGEQHYSGTEQSGCPELRAAHRVIGYLTDEQFNTLNVGMPRPPALTDV